MMKQTFFVASIMFFNLSFAQDKTRDEVLELMAQDTCECIKNDPDAFSAEVSMSQKEMSLGFCLLTSYNTRKSESPAFANSTVNDFESLGEEVGFKLMNYCAQDFMDIFSAEELGGFMEDDFEELGDIPPPPPAPKNENDLQLEADLMSLNNDAVSYITVKDAFDKTHTFIINEQFEGFDLLKKSNYNKSFKIYYKEKDFFDLSERKYVKKKVIKYLELL